MCLLDEQAVFRFNCSELASCFCWHSGAGPSTAGNYLIWQELITMDLERSFSPFYVSLLRGDLQGRSTRKWLKNWLKLKWTSGSAIIPAITCLPKSSLLATDPSTCQKERAKHSCASHSLAMKEGGGSESTGTSWLLVVEVRLKRPSSSIAKQFYSLFKNNFICI